MSQQLVWGGCCSGPEEAGRVCDSDECHRHDEGVQPGMGDSAWDPDVTVFRGGVVSLNMVVAEC